MREPEHIAIGRRLGHRVDADAAAPVRFSTTTGWPRLSVRLLGVARYPVVVPTGLSMIVVDRDPLVAVLPKRHPLAAKPKMRLRDLADQPFIQYSHVHAPSMSTVVYLAGQGAGFEPPIAQEATQLQTIVSLVESGLGVALVPRSCVALLGQNVAYRPVSDHKEQLSVGLALVYSPSAKTPMVRNFIDVLTSKRAPGKG